MRRMDMNPDDVHTREDLAEFVRRLVADLRSNPTDWENRALDDFLDAMSGWIDGMRGYFKNNNLPEPEHPNWSLFATMLEAARSYE
jgi:hypothetical protein